MKRWKSIAEWESYHGFQDNITVDQHDTEEQASAVCRMLEKYGLGGERIHFPINTKVEEIAIGEKVRYNDGYKQEKGIIKEFSGENHAFVVYHCNDDWANYKDYTGARTCIIDLKLGW
jgi:hypothetical protein